MSTDYTPIADTIPHRVLAHMRMSPAGTAFSPAELATELEVSSKNVANNLAAAIKHGFIVRRDSTAGVKFLLPYDDDSDGGDPIRQRNIPAAGTKPPATTAPSSVFDLARKAGSAPVPPLAAHQIVIRKGIPKPSVRGGAAPSIYLDVLQRMEPTDSVELPAQQAKSFYARAKEFGKVQAPPRQYSFRKLSQTTAGVWRDA